MFESYCNLHCKHLTGYSHQVQNDTFGFKMKNFCVFYQTCSSLQYVAMHHRGGQFLCLVIDEALHQGQKNFPNI